MEKYEKERRKKQKSRKKSAKQTPDAECTDKANLNSDSDSGAFEVQISPAPYTQIREIKESELETENLFGGSSLHQSAGSFRNEGDNRSLLTRENYNKRESLNSSYSYTYNNMYCCCCATPHPLLGKNIAPVIVLSDQSFPAAVPSLGSGKCMAIMRVENGSLAEIVDLFPRKNRMEWLPAGTLILIGSLSQLAKDGLTSYVVDYTMAINRLLDALPKNCVVGHAPPILFNGSSDRALIRSL